MEMLSSDVKTNSQNLLSIYVDILGLAFSRFQAKEFKLLVLVLSCCVICYEKIVGFKQHTFIIT